MLLAGRDFRIRAASVSLSTIKRQAGFLLRKEGNVDYLTNFNRRRLAKL